MPKLCASLHPRSNVSLEKNKNFYLKSEKKKKQDFSMFMDNKTIVSHFRQLDVSSTKINFRFLMNTLTVKNLFIC